jgi:hypothetical protein
MPLFTHKVRLAGENMYKFSIRKLCYFPLNSLVQVIPHLVFVRGAHTEPSTPFSTKKEMFWSTEFTGQPLMESTHIKDFFLLSENRYSESDLQLFENRILIAMTHLPVV